MGNLGFVIGVIGKQAQEITQDTWGYRTQEQVSNFSEFKEEE